MSLKIMGAGSCLPKYILTNEKLSEFLDTSDEWITLRTGIKERRILSGETLEDIAVAAAKNALKESGVKASELDYIICSTVNGEYAVPSLACLVQAGIGAGCPSFDINAACTGFIYGLNLAKAYFDGNMAKKILLVAAEALSEMTDYTDRSTAVLFGDGAGAVVLEKGENLLSVEITATGGAKDLNIPSTRSHKPFLPERKKAKLYFYMNGGEVFKFAVKSMIDDIKKVMKKSDISVDDVDYFLIHQANTRIIDTAAIKLKIPKYKLLKTIEKYGNTSASCIPIMIDEFIKSGTLKKGDIVVMSAFGGGMTTGAAVLKI